MERHASAGVQRVCFPLRGESARRGVFVRDGKSDRPAADLAGPNHQRMEVLVVDADPLDVEFSHVVARVEPQVDDRAAGHERDCVLVPLPVRHKREVFGLGFGPPGLLRRPIDRARAVGTGPGFHAEDHVSGREPNRGVQVGIEARRPNLEQALGHGDFAVVLADPILRRVAEGPLPSRFDPAQPGRRIDRRGLGRRWSEQGAQKHRENVHGRAFFRAGLRFLT